MKQFSVYENMKTELGCVPQYNFENKDARRNNWLNLAYSVLKSVENQNSNENVNIQQAMTGTLSDDSIAESVNNQPIAKPSVFIVVPNEVVIQPSEILPSSSRKERSKQKKKPESQFNQNRSQSVKNSFYFSEWKKKTKKIDEPSRKIFKINTETKKNYRRLSCSGTQFGFPSSKAKNFENIEIEILMHRKRRFTQALVLTLRQQEKMNTVRSSKLILNREILQSKKVLEPEFQSSKSKSSTHRESFNMIPLVHEVKETPENQMTSSQKNPIQLKLVRRNTMQIKNQTPNFNPSEPGSPMKASVVMLPQLQKVVSSRGYKVTSPKLSIYSQTLKIRTNRSLANILMKTQLSEKLQNSSQINNFSKNVSPGHFKSNSSVMGCTMGSNQSWKSGDKRKTMLNIYTKKQALIFKKIVNS